MSRINLQSSMHQRVSYNIFIIFIYSIISLLLIQVLCSPVRNDNMAILQEEEGSTPSSSDFGGRSHPILTLATDQQTGEFTVDLASVTLPDGMTSFGALMSFRCSPPLSAEWFTRTSPSEPYVMGYLDYYYMNGSQKKPSVTEIYGKTTITAASTSLQIADGPFQALECIIMVYNIVPGQTCTVGGGFVPTTGNPMAGTLYECLPYDNNVYDIYAISKRTTDYKSGPGAVQTPVALWFPNQNTLPDLAQLKYAYPSQSTLDLYPGSSLSFTFLVSTGQVASTTSTTDIIFSFSAQFDIYVPEGINVDDLKLSQTILQSYTTPLDTVGNLPILHTTQIPYANAFTFTPYTDYLKYDEFATSQIPLKNLHMYSISNIMLNLIPKEKSGSERYNDRTIYGPFSIPASPLPFISDDSTLVINIASALSYSNNVLIRSNMMSSSDGYAPNQITATLHTSVWNIVSGGTFKLTISVPEYDHTTGQYSTDNNTHIIYDDDIIIDLSTQLKTVTAYEYYDNISYTFDLGSYLNSYTNIIALTSSLTSIKLRHVSSSDVISATVKNHTDIVKDNIPLHILYGDDDITSTFEGISMRPVFDTTTTSSLPLPMSLDIDKDVTSDPITDGLFFNNDATDRTIIPRNGHSNTALYISVPFWTPLRDIYNPDNDDDTTLLFTTSLQIGGHIYCTKDITSSMIRYSESSYTYTDITLNEYQSSISIPIYLDCSEMPTDSIIGQDFNIIIHSIVDNIYTHHTDSSLSSYLFLTSPSSSTTTEEDNNNTSMMMIYTATITTLSFGPVCQYNDSICGDTEICSISAGTCITACQDEYNNAKQMCQGYNSQLILDNKLTCTFTCTCPYKCFPDYDGNIIASNDGYCLTSGQCTCPPGRTGILCQWDILTGIYSIYDGIIVLDAGNGDDVVSGTIKEDVFNFLRSDDTVYNDLFNKQITHPYMEQILVPSSSDGDGRGTDNENNNLVQFSDLITLEYATIDIDIGNDGDNDAIIFENITSQCTTTDHSVIQFTVHAAITIYSPVQPSSGNTSIQQSHIAALTLSQYTINILSDNSIHNKIKDQYTTTIQCPSVEINMKIIPPVSMTSQGYNNNDKSICPLPYTNAPDCNINQQTISCPSYQHLKPYNLFDDIYRDPTQCICDERYTGNHCQQLVQCEDMYNDLDKCNGRGIVELIDGSDECSSQCTCIPSYLYSGDQCQDTITPCDNKCDHETSMCIDGRCQCRYQEYGWVQQEQQQEGTENQDDKYTCGPVCGCQNDGICQWIDKTKSTFTCQCQDGWIGDLCQAPDPSRGTDDDDDDSNDNGTCTVDTFGPSICHMGHVICSPSIPSSSSPHNRSECKCSSSVWGNDTDKINTSTGIGTYCSLCNLNDPSNTTNRCNPDGTHRVSYTAIRCSQQQCICNQGYTGDRCNNNASYGQVIYTADNNTTIDFNTIDYQYWGYIILSYLRSSIFKQYSILPQSQYSIYMSLYKISIKTVPAQQSSSDNDGNMILSCPDGITTPRSSDKQCIVSLSYIYILDKTAIQAAFDAAAEQSPFIIAAGSMTDTDIPNDQLIDTLATTSTLESLYGSWDDSITTLPTDNPQGITDTFGSTNTPTTQHIYDSELCKQNPTTTSGCQQDIDYNDTQYDTEAQNTDNAFPPLLPSTITPTSSNDKKNNVGIIVGVVVGIIIIFVIILVLLCICKRKQILCFAPSQHNKNSNRNSRHSRSGTEISMATHNSSGHHVSAAADAPQTKSALPQLATPENIAAANNNNKDDTAIGATNGNTTSAGAASSTTSSSTRMSLDQRPLPSEWKQLVDPHTGKIYYFNEKTLTSSWSHPDDQGNDDKLW